mmetsp:Transcript_46760/g.100085  ORF Transcript_46760/g.100085 Transcript_46760/m.100085 type:complete len:360 (+) Transcript_46760:106-1185(+)|eukprot:CAMPEP_0206451268 /NCGR_PEP_ID=MMETSP0324_2-20121206/19233_1 /ASSEMBLY_ACC=CAM_ASM_000836 /TAXON_ID=2866 /ORGANISM="Crypthecodinium cohnii, Strain Seligo" /LENGTH=359 /DNA_ID=CAMNT_0053921103 /DNA_START=89 /DNA_END=1168 /DNA_ORIENTATION=+
MSEEPHGGASSSSSANPTLSFQGRVAVITGAGNGLGRQYALALAARGAKVVVNDLGTAGNGSGSSSAPADHVVEEIKKAGGRAVANYNSVEDGAKIIKTAIDHFGRVDIVVNNAGIIRDVSFKKMTETDWDLVYRVHLKGAFSVTRAAWPYFLKQGYGRIVNISSPAGLYGNYGQVNYSTAKRGIIGFTLALHREGRRNGIKANVVAPVAASRMLETVMSKEAMSNLDPSTVANLVAFLAAEECPTSGDIFEVGGLWVSKLRWQRSKGVEFEPGFTLEDLADQFDAISDFSEGAEYPTDFQGMVDKALTSGIRLKKSGKQKQSNSMRSDRSTKSDQSTATDAGDGKGKQKKGDIAKSKL